MLISTHAHDQGRSR